MSLSDRVWDRMKEADLGDASTVNWRLYVALVSFFTLSGLLAFAGLSFVSYAWKLGLMEIILVGLAVPILGIVIAQRSETFGFALLGYSMIVVGLGLISGPSLRAYDAGTIMSALFATLGTTAVTSVIGICSKRSLAHWGTYLFVGLIALLLVRLAQVFLLASGVPAMGGWWTLVPYVGAALFSLFIVYDWNRAMQVPWTVRNALDAAINLFLDMVNLFQLFLEIFGFSSKD